MADGKEQWIPMLGSTPALSLMPPLGSSLNPDELREMPSVRLSPAILTSIATMKSIRYSALLLACSPCAFAEPLAPEGTLDLFEINGPKECWSMQDGVITGKNVPEKKGSILWTKARYKDFTLEGEFRYTNPVDSGVFLRQEGDQIQLGVSGSLKRDMTCSPYIAKTGKYPVEANVKDVFKDGEWNKFVITAKGNHYVVTLNGKQVLDYTSQTAIDEGPVGFQVHPGVEMKVEFRTLDVKRDPAK